MSGKKFTYNPPAAKPKRPSAERVVSERGRKELPPGTKGGENLKPDRHYEHSHDPVASPQDGTPTKQESDKHQAVKQGWHPVGEDAQTR